jgi:DNA-binding transcriptional LysR family regulator
VGVPRFDIAELVAGNVDWDVTRLGPPPGSPGCRAGARGAAALRHARYVVGSPGYFNTHGRPKHPLHLAQHRCLTYSFTVATEAWHFTKGAKSASVQPSGPLRVNNGDAMMPALIAGTGIGILPEFFLRDALATRQLERVLPDWSLPLGAVYLVTPPGEPQPKRVEALTDFLVKKLGARRDDNRYSVPAA